ncbi:hypothetical protein D3C76_1678420 [compost metagenome]
MIYIENGRSKCAFNHQYGNILCAYEDMLDSVLKCFFELDYSVQWESEIGL